MKNKLNFKKYIIWTKITIGSIFVILLGYFIFFAFVGKNKLPQVCSQDVCFTVEIARTPAQRQQGLMYREAMSSEHGMLFVFNSSDFYNFWMKNTLIPLDMIWIDDQFKIVRVLTADPCISEPCPIYKPETFSKYVLELNAGIAAKYKMQEGTKVIFRNIQ